MFARAALERELNPPLKTKPAKSPSVQRALDFGTGKRKATEVVELPTKRTLVDTSFDEKHQYRPSQLMIGTMSRQSSFGDSRGREFDGFGNSLHRESVTPTQAIKEIISLDDSDDEYLKGGDDMDWDALDETCISANVKLTI
jgi:hypothetical protein